jgi:serine/threonine protein kinase
MVAANHHNPIDKYEVDRNSFRTAQKVGEGKYCEVFCGWWRNTEVAIKQLNPDTMSSLDFLIEAENMKKLEQRKLLKLLAVCSTSEPICMITEYMAYGSLLDYLKGL